MSVFENSKLYTYKQLAKKLNLSLETIKKWLEIGKLPKPIAISRKTKLFDGKTLNQWLEDKRPVT